MTQNIRHSSKSIYFNKPRLQHDIYDVVTNWAMFQAPRGKRTGAVCRADLRCVGGCCWAGEEPWCTAASERWAGQWAAAGDNVDLAHTTAAYVNYYSISPSSDTKLLHLRAKVWNQNLSTAFGTILTMFCISYYLLKRTSPSPFIKFKHVRWNQIKWQ